MTQSAHRRIYPQLLNIVSFLVVSFSLFRADAQNSNSTPQTVPAVLLNSFLNGCSLNGGAMTEALDSRRQLTDALASLDGALNPNDASSSACRTALSALQGTLNIQPALAGSLAPSDGSSPSVRPAVMTTVQITQLDERLRAAENAYAVVLRGYEVENSKPPRPYNLPVGADASSMQNPDVMSSLARRLREAADALTDLRNQRARAGVDTQLIGIIQSQQLAVAAVPALMACQGSPAAYGALIGPVMGIGSALGGIGGVAAAGLVAVGEVVGSLVGVLTRNNAAQNALENIGSAAAPTAIFCAMQNLSTKFCNATEAVRDHRAVADAPRQPMTGVNCTRPPSIFEGFQTLEQIRSLTTGLASEVPSNLDQPIGQGIDAINIRIQSMANYARFVADELSRTPAASASLRGQADAADRFAERLEAVSERILHHAAVASRGGTTRQERSANRDAIRLARESLRMELQRDHYFDVPTAGAGPLATDLIAVISSHRLLVDPHWGTAADRTPNLDLLQRYSALMATGDLLARNDDAWERAGGAQSLYRTHLEGLGGVLRPQLEAALTSAIAETRRLRDSGNATSADAQWTQVLRLCEASLSAPSVSVSIQRECASVPMGGNGPRNVGGRNYSTLVGLPLEERACFLPRLRRQEAVVAGNVQ